MTILTVVTVVAIGLLVGVELAVAVFVNPIFDRLPGTAGLAARSDGARVLGRVMPFWYGAAVLLGAASAVVAGGSGVAAVAAGTALLVVAVVLSVTLLVPINDRARTWTEGDAPADWREQLQRWDRLHYGRTALLVVAFVLVAAGLVA
jgi:uncharacterized membrane protein